MLDPTNPFAAPSTLPHGLPPLQDIRDEHILPAFTEGLAEQRAEWEAIATDAAAPTLENTILAIERSGRLLHRVLVVHWLRTGVLQDDVVREQDAVIGPALAEHGDAFTLDVRILARLDALVAEHPEAEDPAAGAPGGPTDDVAEQRRLLHRMHLGMVRAGARLDEDGRATLRQLNVRLSSLQTAFSAALVRGANDAAVHLTDRDDLAGMPDDAVAAAAAAAAERGLDGWLLTLSLFSSQPALAWLERRDVRRRLHEASVGRGLSGPHDTRPIVAEVMSLRAERAGLLGFASHAAWAIADQTAGTVEAVDRLLSRLTAPAVANACAEAATLESLLHEDGHDGPLQAWDWPFYAARRAAGEGIDAEALREWFPLEAVLRDGVLFAASHLYDLTFTPRPELPRHHPDVIVHEVARGAGPPIGLFLLDPYARPSKRGGAWMSTLSDQSRLLGTDPVVTLAMNIPRPAAGAPALLTLDEVRTLFHEFGHAIHGLLSDVLTPSLSGTSIPRDLVEFPSQVNEMWALHQAVLPRYARHHRTGEPLPEEVTTRLMDRGAAADGAGLATTEYLAATLLDLAWHRLPPGTTVAAAQVEAFEDAALMDAGVALPNLVPRYRTTYFAHSMSSGYDARYYAYIWAEVLDAEMVRWFEGRGGLQAESGALFADLLLARGGSVDPMAAFEAIVGRAPTPDALLERRGLTGPVGDG